MQRLHIVVAVLLMVMLGAVAGSAASRGEYKGLPVAQVVVNGKQLVSDVPPVVIDGRTMLPVRAVAEALGAQVGWDAATQTVQVTTAKGVGRTLLWAKKGENVVFADFATDARYEGLIIDDGGVLTLVPRSDIAAMVQGRMTSEQLLQRATWYHVAPTPQAGANREATAACDRVRATVRDGQASDVAKVNRYYAAAGTFGGTGHQRALADVEAHWNGVLAQQGCSA